MIDFIKNILMVNKNINKTNPIEQLDFEERLDHYKNNNSHLHAEQRDRNTIYFV